MRSCARFAETLAQKVHHLVVRTLPLLFTPTPYSLLVVDDSQITLVAVELRPAEVVVFLRALVEDPDAEEDAYLQALEAWAVAGREGSPPDDPGNRRFARVTVSVSDDTGASYTLWKQVAGGSGRFFNAECYFKGAVPDHARVLTVTAADDEGQQGSAQVFL